MQNSNIQLLLQAEQEALAIVASARTFRETQLQEAAHAATRELSLIRTQHTESLADQHHKLQLQFAQEAHKLQIDLQQRLAEVQCTFAANVDRVADQLITDCAV